MNRLERGKKNRTQIDNCDNFFFFFLSEKIENYIKMKELKYTKGSEHSQTKTSRDTRNSKTTE